MANENNNSSSSGSSGLCGVLFIVFLVLKLAEIGQVAYWSWWAVTAPLWVPFALIAAFFAAGTLVAGVAGLLALLDKMISKRRVRNDRRRRAVDKHLS